jgi:RNA polymerase sigma-70 factor, ECF subfamily
MIDQAARGAWRDLEAKLRPFVGKRLRSEADVDDVVQDVFLRMQRGLADLRDDERFGPWVYQVARSAIAEHQRRAMRHPLADAEPPEAEAPSDEPDSDAISEELAMYVAPFIAMLPSPYREALTLTELEGLTQKEAACRSCKWVAAMPDVHWGIGATVGSVIPTAARSSRPRSASTSAAA